MIDLQAKDEDFTVVSTSALASLKRMVEELERDAARYRWLRDTPWLDTPIERIIALQQNAIWDSAIDSAMKHE